jgi:hypothetical protein
MARTEIAKQDDVPEIARRNRPEPVAQARTLGAAAFARAGFQDPTLVLHWADIVGGDVARFAQPVKLAEGPSGGVLTLRAEPAAAVFLQHETRTLCQRINAYLGRPAVARLRFVTGPVEARPAAPRPAPLPTRPPESDPAHGFAGPDRLKSALINLARTRLRPTRD